MSDDAFEKIEDAFELGRGWFDGMVGTTPSTAPALLHPAPSLADTLARLGEVIAASDKLTRAQIKPILDQLLETPEQAVELGQRLEATIAIQQRPEAPLPTPVADQVLAAKPITRTSDFVTKVPAKP